MAWMSGQRRTCNFVSTSSPKVENFEELPSRKPNQETLSCSRQRTIFPLGIVRDYNLKDRNHNSITEEKILPENVVLNANKWNSSPCLNASYRNARWGTRILQPKTRDTAREESFDGLQVLSSQSRIRRYRSRMNSCPSSSVNDLIRVEVPKLPSIMVRAHSVPLLTRCHSAALKKSTASGSGNSLQKDDVDVRAVTTERPKKKIVHKDSISTRRKMGKLSSLSEIKIEDGVIVLDNGKFIDLKVDKPRKKESQLKGKEASKNSQSYREFQAALQEFEDAQFNLQQEVTAKPKTFQTKDKEQEFFEENVQTQFLDLLSSVKDGRKKKRKKDGH